MNTGWKSDDLTFLLDNRVFCHLYALVPDFAKRRSWSCNLLGWKSGPYRHIRETMSIHFILSLFLCYWRDSRWANTLCSCSQDNSTFRQLIIGESHDRWIVPLVMMIFSLTFFRSWSNYVQKRKPSVGVKIVHRCRLDYEDRKGRCWIS